MNGGYEEGYAACDCFWGKHPASLVRELLSVTAVAGKEVLDVGCGEGKNSIALAAEGAIVTAFDISPLAIEHAKRESKGIPSISYAVRDIRTEAIPPNSFDIVVAYGLLHCMPDEAEIARMLEMLKQTTRLGGYLVVCAFNDRHQELDAHPGFFPVTLEHSSYLRMFEGWTLLHSSDSDLTEVHPHNGIQHTHSMTRILARKDVHAHLP